MKELLNYFQGTCERHGFVMKDGSIIELENKSQTPEDSYLGDPEQVIKYCDDAVATWHTHPGKDSNLSAGDHDNFMNWPNLDHFIIGEDGISRYKVRGKVLIKDDA